MGSSPSKNVGTAISATDAVSAALRPILSPMWPKTRLPKGRRTNRRKSAERGKQRDNRVLRREEPTAYDRGEIALDAKVVPFHHIAGEDGSPLQFRTTALQHWVLSASRDQGPLLPGYFTVGVVAPPGMQSIWRRERN